MKSLIEYLLIHIVTHPDSVEVEELQTGDNSFTYAIHTHEEDIGRVIGKHGSVIQAIRTITKMRAIKEGVHAHVTIDD